jgi:DNA repair protein RecO (recombination protein O)
MRTYASDALILRTYRFGEADRIVVFLTADRGKRRGVAKHASKSRRRFGGALEPLTRGRVAYREREHRDLVWLERIEPLNSPLKAIGAGGAAGQHGSAHVLAHASYFAELLDEWAPEASPNERLFRLGAAVGDALTIQRAEGSGGSSTALARYFEYWLLRLEGVYPALDVCPRCLRATLGDGAVLVPGERRYVCDDCVPGGPRLSGDAVGFLRRAGTRTPGEVAADRVGQQALRELEDVHHRLIAMHLEKELRSARVVRELGPES